jgi:hypothetical protein
MPNAFAYFYWKSALAVQISGFGLFGGPWKFWRKVRFLKRGKNRVILAVSFDFAVILVSHLREIRSPSSLA